MKSNQVEEARRNHADEEEKQKERSHVLHPKRSRVATLSYCMAPLLVAPFFFFLLVSRNPPDSKDSFAIFDGMRAIGAGSQQQNYTNAGTNGDNRPRKTPLKKSRRIRMKERKTKNEKEKLKIKMKKEAEDEKSPRGYSFLVKISYRLSHFAREHENQS